MSGSPECDDSHIATSRDTIKSLYPEALSTTYCVPPVHFNKVPFVRHLIPGTDQLAHVQAYRSEVVEVLPPICCDQNQRTGESSVQTVVPPALWAPETKPQSQPANVQASDVQADLSQRIVLNNLQALGNSCGEVMFIISQLNFGSYLGRPSYAAAASHLPRPLDLDEVYQRGEFDILLIHRHLGIFIGEIKSVGKSYSEGSWTQDRMNEEVAKRFKKAVEQLHKSEKVLKHLLSDIGPVLSLRKIIFLPFLASDRLQDMLAANPELKEHCGNLGVAGDSDFSDLCVCSDHLHDADAGRVRPPVHPKLKAWWQRMKNWCTQTYLDDNLYLDLLARFVGPATTVKVHCNIASRVGMAVEVRTEGEAVAELGHRLARLVLTQQQLDLLHRAPRMACVTGPPGTGKTLVLVLTALKWLREGCRVHIISPYPESRAASYLIQHQLQVTCNTRTSETQDSIVFHKYDFYQGQPEVTRAVTDLSAAVWKESLHILLDEAGFGNDVARRGLQVLIKDLTDLAPHLHLWTSCIDKCPNLSPCLQIEALTLPLRSAPAIVAEVQPAFSRLSHLQDYSQNSFPAPGDGMAPIRLHHNGPAHVTDWTLDCRQCGLDIAAELRRLEVGKTRQSAELASSTDSPTLLSYRDVFILTRCSKLHDDITDDPSNVTLPACGLVQGLRAAGMPLFVVSQRDKKCDVEGWERKVKAIATGQVKEIVVAHVTAVFGLENKVVVWLPGRDLEFDNGRNQERIEAGDRLVIASRATAQLLIVEAPFGEDPVEDEK